jgi:glycosyltransferase involved in cell wall biosynthesis
VARNKATKAPAKPRPLIALAVNDAWNIVNYRSRLVRALGEAGYRIAVLAPDGPHVPALRELGVDFVAVSMSPRGTSPIGDLGTLLAYRRALAALRPAALLGFTSKPNIYGSLAAHSLGIPVINNISGLGAVFAKDSWLTRVVSRLYKAALRRSATVFFQNRDDQALFERSGLVKPGQSALLPGSGIDLDHFKPAKRRKGGDGHATFLFAARLLWDKGVREYVEAARQVRRRSPQTRFRILGMIEPPGKTAVPEADLRAWAAEGAIDYIGAATDVRQAFADADCVVLPSYYREGVPRVLLEASSMAIPSITTNAAGCREAVDDGVTGFLCEPRSVASLVGAIERMAALPPTKRKAMGSAARAKMERQFRDEIVHRAYLTALAKLGISGQ